MKNASSKNVSPLTYTEYDILCVLWNEGHPLTSPEILEKFPNNKDWSSASITLILNNMLKKKVLKIEGYTLCGRVYGRLFAPTMDQFDYAANEALKFISNQPKKKRILGLAATLFEHEDVDIDTINTLTCMLEEQRKKLNKTE